MGNSKDHAKRHTTKYPGVYYRIVERPGGKGPERLYFVRFKKDGRLVDAKVGRQYQDDMTPARASQLRAEFIEGTRLTPQEERQRERGRWPISRIWQVYVETKGTAYKGRKQDADRFRLHLEPVFGKKTLAEIAPLDVDRLRVRLGKGGLSPQSVKLVLELLRRLGNFADKRRLCPALGFKLTLPRVDSTKTEDLTPEQLAALLRVLDLEQEGGNINVAAAMRLVLFTGLRQGELWRLRWDDLDFQRGFILIREPKGGKAQSIPMNEGARALLEAHPRTPGSPYVFPGRGGKQRHTAAETLRRIREAAGLPKDFRPLHGLRHVFASMLASSGKVDLYTLQKLLTHKSPTMTQRYAHLRDEAMRRASGVADDIMCAVGAEGQGAGGKVVKMRGRGHDGR